MIPQIGVRMDFSIRLVFKNTNGSSIILGMKTKKNNRKLKKIIWVAILVAVIVAVALCIHFRSDNKKNVATTRTVVGTPSTPTPHSSVPSTSNGTTQGGVVDNNGTTSSSVPPASEWTSSNNGDITLQQPVTNQVVASGATLSGTAKVPTVQFILKDSSVGLIAQGSLNVVDSRFAGTLQFTPHAKTGNLEVYFANPQTGAEEDIININVNFN
jgi:hypothetical protein